MEKTAAPSLPGLNKFFYSFAYIGISIVDRVMASCVMFYYLPPAGKGEIQLVPTAAFGIIFLIGRVLDTFIDPGVAFYSDRCTSRRGRRMPFMLYGGLPLAASLALMFFPPVKGISAWNVVYLCVMLSTFFFFFSFYVCPYLGLLPELVRTAEERINLTSSQGIFMLLGTVVGMAGSFMLIGPLGYKGMALAMAGLAVISFYAPVASIDEKKYCVSEPSSLGIIDTVKATLKNKPFVIYLVGNLTFWFGFNIISTCVPYYVTVLLKLDKSQIPYFFLVALGSALVFIPVINLLSRRIGKRDTMIFSLVLFMILLPSIYLFGLNSISLNHVTFAYIVMVLIGLPLASLFIVPNAMVADLTDYDEKLTGMRREAIYFGSQGFFLKAILGLSTLLNTTMFNYYGFSLSHPLGIRLTGPVGGFFALTGIIAFLFFPKDLNAHAEKELIRRVKSGMSGAK